MPTLGGPRAPVASPDADTSVSARGAVGLPSATLAVGWDRRVVFYDVPLIGKIRLDDVNASEDITGGGPTKASTNNTLFPGGAPSAYSGSIHQPHQLQQLATSAAMTTATAAAVAGMSLFRAVSVKLPKTASSGGYARLTGFKWAMVEVKPPLLYTGACLIKP